MIDDMNNTKKNDFLIHYGVKGMKWGIRKQIQARKRFKKSNKYNYNKTQNEYKKKMASFYKKDQQRFNRATSEKQIRNLENVSYKESSRLQQKGRYAVRKAGLLDAGYSKKEAEIGAKWMERHGFNFTWSDGDFIVPEY